MEPYWLLGLLVGFVVGVSTASVRALRLFLTSFRRGLGYWARSLRTRF